MGVRSTSCSQPAFPSHHEKPWHCKPSGMVNAIRHLWGPKHKQGPWTGPKRGADKCAEQGQMELIMEQRAPPAATSQSNHLLLQPANQTRPNHVPGNFLGSLRRGTQPKKPANDVDHSLKPCPYKRQVQTDPMWTNG